MTALSCVDAELLLATAGDGARPPLLAAHLSRCDACRALSASLHADGDEFPAVGADAYLLGAEVARGGMGRIRMAHDLRIGRELVVKELVARSPSLTARFEREARLTARLQHPGIVPIYEIGRWSDGTPFYAMPLVKGVTLRAALARITPDGRLALVPRLLAACEAIAYAHGRGVIHRDLSPGNIMLGDHGETVVIDWGLAKEIGAAEPVTDAEASPSSDSELTVDGAVLGTKGFMAPEQARGEPVDARADVYALGAVFRHVLAGLMPPRDLTSVVDKALAENPADRYPDAGALAREVRHFLEGRLVDAHAYGVGERIWRWIRQHPLVVTTTVAVAVVGAIALAGIVRQRDRAIAAERATAQQQRATEGALAALYEREGEIRLETDDLFGGAAYLAEAHRLGRRGLRLDMLRRRAQHGLAAIEAWAAPVADAGPVTGITWSHDDRLVAVHGSYEVRILDARDGRQVSAIELTGPPDAQISWSVAFSPDDKLLLLEQAAGDRCGLYEVATARAVRTWSRRDDHFADWWFATDAELVEVDGNQEHWRRIDAVSGTEHARGDVPVPEDPASLAEPRRTAGRFLVVEEYGAVELRDAPSNGRIVRFPGAAAGRFDHAGTRLALLRPDRGVAIVSLERLGPTTRSSASDHHIDNILDVSDDGRLVLGSDGDVPILHEVDGSPRPIGALRLPATLAGDGSRVAAWDGSAIVVVDASTGVPKARFDHIPARPIKLELSRQGQQLLMLTAARSMLVFSVEDQRALAPPRDDVLDASFGHDARWLVACDEGGGIYLRNMSTEKETVNDGSCARVELLRAPRFAAVRDASGKQLFLDDRGETFLPFDEELDDADPTGAVSVVRDGGAVRMSPIAVTANYLSDAEIPEGDTSLAAYDRAPLLVDPTGPVQHVAMAPFGWYFATERGVWTPHGNLVWPFPPGSFTAPVDRLRFSPDGQWLVVVDARGELTRWPMGGPGVEASTVAERVGLSINRDGTMVHANP